MKVNKHPLRFESGSEGKYVTGFEYRIPFGGMYAKYDDGGKVFKFFSKDGTVRYGAQFFREVWHVKVEVYFDPKSCQSVQYIGRSTDFREAFKQVRTEIAEHKIALAMLPKLKP